MVDIFYIFKINCLWKKAIRYIILCFRFKIMTLHSLQRYSSPGSLQRYSSPSSLQRYSSPSSLQRYSSPSSLQRYSSPSSLQRYSSPSSLQRYSSPSSLQRYSSPSSTFYWHVRSICINVSIHEEGRFGLIKLALPRHFLLKCLN